MRSAGIGTEGIVTGRRAIPHIDVHGLNVSEGKGGVEVDGTEKFEIPAHQYR